MTSDDIETVGMGMTWEQLPVGRRLRTIGRTIGEPDLSAFVNATGMLEVLFTNTQYLEHSSAIKGRVVPAALLYCFAEGLLIQSIVQGVGLAFLRMDLEVKNPTFVGDTIHVEVEVIECRESKSRPGTGLVRTRNTIVKQDGAVSLVYTPLRLLKGADWTPAASPSSSPGKP